MAKLVWDKIGERFYETGIEKGVLYPAVDGAYPKGVAWNGLINVSEKPSGAESTPLYADNIKYLNLISAEEFAATIEAYTYPEEFGKCDGSVDVVKGVKAYGQPRQSFGLAYVTKIGNDTKGDSLGYKIHLVYGCLAAPSEKSYATINDSPEAITFSWEITTTPISVKGHKPTAILTIDSTKVDADKLAKVEEKLFGGDSSESMLPLPDEIIQLINEG